MDSPSHTHSQTPYERFLERKLDMGRGTTEKEERRIAANLANATSFIRSRHIATTQKNQKNHPDIFVDSPPSAYTAAAYLNGELYMANTRLATVSQKTIPELELMAMALGAQLGQFRQQTPCHCGRNIILERFTSLPCLAQINQDTEDNCSQPSEHDQKLQM